MPADDVPWLDQDQPQERDRSDAQINALLGRFTTPATIMDLGCGGGRVLQPLIESGHTVVGLDRDHAAINRCRNATAGHPVALFETDFTKPGWASHGIEQHGPYDAVLVLGNTFMTIWNVDAAVTLLREIRHLLSTDGVLILDDIPHDLWPLLTEGAWITGVSAVEPDDEADDAATAAQLIWSPDDAVFTLRNGRDVDTERWTIGLDDPRYRLWTMGSLTLAARLAGLSAPAHDAEGGLLILERSQCGSPGN